MKTILSEAVCHNCLRPFGIDEADAIAVIEHPEQSEAIALSEDTQTLTLFAGRPHAMIPDLVLLISGRLSAEVFTADMAFKVPADIAGPVGAMKPPLRIFKELAEQFGLPLIIGNRIERFISGERVTVRSVDAIGKPDLQNRENVPYMSSWMVRPIIQADCDLCFAIDLNKYRTAIGALPAPNAAPEPPVLSGGTKHRIAVTLNKEVQELMRFAGIPFERAGMVLNEHDTGIILSTDTDKPSVVAIRWFDDGQIVFVQGVVTKSRWEGTLVTIETVAAALVLALRSDLPGGKLERTAAMETIFPLIARSFGVPTICHPDIGPAKFQSGPWDGNVPFIDAPQTEPVVLTGTFNPSANICDCVWALSLNLYRNWWRAGLAGAR
ncbi:MAG TPA: hypothetical protein VFC78_13490 [Tepidisphaeraceae bacterium]|nr:hypothetical protein [Tepidisphaeraceae bacterium]